MSCAGSCPGLEVDWLAQNPVTRVLEKEGERIHPMSRHLASESGHMESESSEHDLHCFQAWRRMDEILVANYMVFHDVVREERYDLWVGDEAWDVDYYLHEHPSEKLAPYAWLTDFVGWLPMEDGGSHESYLTADYNAEMVEHIDAHPGSATARCSWATRTTSCPTGWGPSCPRSATGPSATSTSPATSRASIRRSSETARSCAQSSAIARPNRSASSPWAGRVWGSRCCAR